MSGGRAGAARAVAAVLAGQALDRALTELKLSAETRPFAQALAYSTIRHLGSGQALLRRLLSDPDRPRPLLLDGLILTGLTDLRWLERPAHAAVAETVAESRRLGLERQSGLINAVLRRYLREAGQLNADVADDPVARYEHPRWWIEALRLAWPEQAERLLQADDTRAPMWLRNNRRRGPRSELLRDFAAAGLSCQVHTGLPDALRVDPPRPVEQLPGFGEGRLSVQDAAAQRVVECLHLTPGLRVLDACAAPGGKTAHLLERCPELARVVALDVDDDRLALVRQTLDRLQLTARELAPTELQLLAADARTPQDWWDGQPFDRILIDAPCSGSGVARRHPDIKWLRRESDLPAMARTQGELLDALWPLLAVGGRLLYTTCSVFPQENEAVIAAFLQRQPQAESVPIPALACRQQQGAQRLTGDDDEDGFYYALLQQRSG